MVDTNIAMQTQQPDVGGALRQSNQDQVANAQAAEETLKAHYQNLDSREQSRLRSTIVGAAQLKNYLDKGDVDGAHDFLVQRQAALHARMGSGENVDTQETDYALEKLRTGDIEGLQNDVAGLMAAGQAYGMLGGGDNTPSSVREWQYYNSLSPEQKKEWLKNKRAGSTVDLGGTVKRFDAGGSETGNYTKTLAPADQPENVAAKAAAGVTGAAMGDAAVQLETIQAQLPALNQVVDKLSRLGKTATYTKAGVAGNEILRQLGADVPQGAVDRTEYMSTVDNEILPLLRQTFGAAFTQKEGESLKATLGDPDKSPEEKDAVLRAFIEAKVREVESLQRRTGQAPTAQPANAQAPAAVKISNGKETYWVSPEDAAAAAAEGFEQVQ
jgi:hypothetical protein